MRKTKTDGLRDFQYINKLGDSDTTRYTYKGVRIDFLKALFGDEWKTRYDDIYGDDKELFLKEWQFELKEWDEFEE